MNRKATLAICACMCGLASAAFCANLSKSVPKGWGEDFAKAQSEAKGSGKLILLAFSGSDWCGWCVKMEKEIYSDKKFISRAKRKFILLMIDSPRNKDILSELAKKQNPELCSTYHVRGYPTTVVVRPDGEEVRRFGGYQRDGVEAFLSKLDEVAKSAGVKGGDAISDDEARKDDRFFHAPADKAKVFSRESKVCKENQTSDFELEEFAGIKFGTSKADGAPMLKEPFLCLSEIQKTTYAGGKLTGFVLATPADTVKGMTDDEFLLTTCKLVHALESELDVKFAVNGSKIDFTGRKAAVQVNASKAAKQLAVKLSVKK